MNSQVQTQKEQYERKEIEKKWYSKSNLYTEYLHTANWLDSIAHAPFHFIGKHMFVGIGIVLAIILSLFTAIPFYILGIGFGVIGYLFSRFVDFKSGYPPYFYSYKHALSYGEGESWDESEQTLMEYHARMPEFSEKLKEQNPESYQKLQKFIKTEEPSYEDESSEEKKSGLQNTIDTFSGIYEKFDALSSVAEGDFSAIGDLIGGDDEDDGGGRRKQENVHYVQPNEQYGLSEEEMDIPKPKRLSRDERQDLYYEAMEELTNMVGLQELKEEVKNMIDEIKANRKLKKQGITPEKTTMHMIFSGPAGTGKTVAARLLAKILQATGYLETGQLVEVNRSDLVAEYQGQTATNVKRKFEEARGGVLFIDEAYALKNGDNDPFGQEAIDTIILLMENYRKEMVVILAGYEAEMNKLMKANSGFQSRIAYKFRFTDYTPEQLTELAMMNIEKRGYIATDLKEQVHKAIKSKAVKGVVEGNGRWVRNFVDKIEKQHKVMLANNEITDGRYIHPNAIEQAIKSMK